MACGYNYQTKICLACGNTFKPNSGVQKYCSNPECERDQNRRLAKASYPRHRVRIIAYAKARYNANRNRIKEQAKQRYYEHDFGDQKCVQCNGIFRALRKQQTFCSKPCQVKYWIAKGKATRWTGDERNRKASAKGWENAKPQFKNTSIERALGTQLKKAGIVFEQNASINSICNADIVIHDQKLAIFCDGDFWHRLPKTMIRDKKINSKLKRKGWIVLRFWGFEIKSNLDECTRQVMAALERR